MLLAISCMAHLLSEMLYLIKKPIVLTALNCSMFRTVYSIGWPTL